MVTNRTSWYDRVKRSLDKFDIVIIQGLRRIGKTVLMNDITNDTAFKNRKHLLLDVGIFGQDDSAEALTIMNIIKSEPNTEFFLTVDEFQDLKDWEKFFKTLHSFKNVKVVASGSISANMDLVDNTEGGRFTYIQMLPLMFEEFKTIRALNDIAVSDEKAFNEYATTGSYPDQEFNFNLTEYKKQVSANIVEKIKNATLLKAAGISSPDHVNTVLLYLIENIGQTTNPHNISKKLLIDIRTIQKILSYLKQTFIIYEISNSIKKAGKAAADNTKYYLTDHTFYLFVKSVKFSDVKTPYSDFIFENIIFNSVRSKKDRYEAFLRFHKTKTADIDMVIQISDVDHYYEIKNSLQGKPSKQQLEFSKTNKLNIIHKGDTTINEEEHGINYINYIEFIEGDKYEHSTNK